MAKKQVGFDLKTYRQVYWFNIQVIKDMSLMLSKEEAFYLVIYVYMLHPNLDFVQIWIWMTLPPIPIWNFHIWMGSQSIQMLNLSKFGFCFCI